MEQCRTVIALAMSIFNGASVFRPAPVGNHVSSRALCRYRRTRSGSESDPRPSYRRTVPVVRTASARRKGFVAPGPTGVREMRIRGCTYKNAIAAELMKNNRPRNSLRRR